MIRHRTRRAALAAAALVLTSAPLAQAAPPSSAVPDSPLPLGPADLSEQRSQQSLAPGVTHSTIVRGDAVRAPWVVEVGLCQEPSEAQAAAERLTAASLPAESTEITGLATIDTPAVTLGHRVRLEERLTDRADADALVAQVRASGFDRAKAWNLSWDGDTDAAGRWTVNVLTIDPRRFRGTLEAVHGPDLERRETTSELAAQADALAAVNGGYFVFDPASGAEGDPAGIGIYDGDLLSEPVQPRPALILDDHARRTAITRPGWSGSVAWAGHRIPLDGVNRVPGLIRNCGGDATDIPTALPVHDVTCRDGEELVAFTEEFGASTPDGEGVEVVLDRRDRVVEVLPRRGTQLHDGQRSLQAIGPQAETLRELTEGTPVRVRSRAQLDTLLTPRTSAVNGGPQLVDEGELAITQSQDGMHQPESLSFDYGWVHQRNPRTFAGVDDEGRTLLVTVDGRQEDESGLSIRETALVAQALGMEDAINLDGGGSTAMVVGEDLVSSPSDAAGERPVGDAIVIRTR